MGFLLLDSYAPTTGTAFQIAVNNGNNQTGTVAKGVTVAPQVVVSDSIGNPVSGTQVIFSLGTGGQTGSGFTQTTDASGLASIGSWSFGTTAGTYTLTATSSGLTGSPLLFTEAAVADVAATMSIASSQTATVPVSMLIIGPGLPTVQVVDKWGNLASGSTVTFAIVSPGNASLSGAAAFLGGPGVGLAAPTALTTPGTVETDSITATLSSVTGSVQTFVWMFVSGGVHDRTNVIWVDQVGIDVWVKLPFVRTPTIVH